MALDTGTPARVVCVGIATLDAIVTVERLPGSDERVPGLDGRLAGGGVAATAAVTLARLGIPTAFVGRVGDDETGRWIRRGLEAEGVGAKGLELAQGRSPISAVLIERGTGLRSLAPFLGDDHRITLTERDLQACASAEWVHFDDRGLSALPAMIAAGITTPISVDDGLGLREVPLDHVALWAPTDRVLAQRFPAGSLHGSLRAALDAGPKFVAATLGSAGSIAAERRADRSIAIHEVPADIVPVRSTLGAGDVFHGALLAGLAEGRAVPDALRRANAVAALSCRELDGRSGIPDRDELEDWLSSASRTTPAGSSRA